MSDRERVYTGVYLYLVTGNTGSSRQPVGMIDFGEFTAIVFLLLAEILYFLNRLVAFRHFVVLEPIVSSMILT